MLRSAVICVLDRKQSKFGTQRGNYAVVFLVSRLVSLITAKCIGLSEHVFFILALYIRYFRTSRPYIIPHGELHEHYNFTGIQLKWVHMRKQSIPGCFFPPMWPGYEATVRDGWVRATVLVLYCQALLQ